MPKTKDKKMFSDILRHFSNACVCWCQSTVRINGNIFQSIQLYGSDWYANEIVHIEMSTRSIIFRGFLHLTFTTQLQAVRTHILSNSWDFCFKWQFVWIVVWIIWWTCMFVLCCFELYNRALEHRRNELHSSCHFCVPRVNFYIWIFLLFVIQAFFDNLSMRSTPLP